MDSSHISSIDQNLRQYKSSSNSFNSVTRNHQKKALDKTNSTIASSRDSQNHLLSTHSTSATVRQTLPQSPPYNTPSGPQSSAPLQASIQDDFDWTFGQSKDIGSLEPIFTHHDSGTGNPRILQQETSYQSRQHPTNMSAVAIQHYDPRFDAGYAAMRQSYTWPNFDMAINHQYHSPMSSPSMTDSLTQFDEPRPMQMYSRADSASPPRGSFTSEQREIKRQRDLARRDSKTRYRRERSASNPYVVSSHPSPALLPVSLSGYTTSHSPSPLLSSVTPALASPPYMASFPPQISDTSGADHFAPMYSMAQDNFSSSGYNVAFPDGLGIGAIPPQGLFPRQHSISSASEHQAYPSPKGFSSSTETESTESIRVVQNRPKPQCWDHGCNGRKFSTFSNLLRHQREKSGVATKSSCPNCGAEFTRTTARNGHMAHDKCKQRKSSQ